MLVFVLYFVNFPGFVSSSIKCCNWFAVQDKSSTSNLKIEALIFTRLVLASHSPPVFHPHIKVRHLIAYLNTILADEMHTWTGANSYYFVFKSLKNYGSHTSHIKKQRKETSFID